MRFCEWWVSSKRLPRWWLDHVVELFNVYGTGSDSPIVYWIRSFGTFSNPTQQSNRGQRFVLLSTLLIRDQLAIMNLWNWEHLFTTNDLLLESIEGIQRESIRKSKMLSERIVPGTRSTNCDSSSEAPAKQAPPYHQEIKANCSKLIRNLQYVKEKFCSSGFEAILFHSSFHISFSRLWASYPGMFALQTQSKALKPGIELHSGTKSARHANWKAFPIHSGQVNPQNKAGPVMLSLGWCHNAPLITETPLKLYNSYANVQLNKNPTRKSDGILPSHAEDSLL